jgi:hypothetical protein
MAVTLVERVRQVVAAEDDDFFKADTILYYLNKSQRKVVSYGMQREKQEPKLSLRALDNLRGTTVVTDPTTIAKGSYFQANINFPSGMLDHQHLRYKNRTILRELNSQKLYMLEWANLVPTIFEGYYYVTNTGSQKVFQVYIHEDPGVADTITIHFIKEPTELTLTSTTLPELPEQLENAVIYGAAMMMVGQESVKDATGNGTLIGELYKEELQSSMY